MTLEHDLKIEVVAIDSIKPYDKNPRVNDQAVDKVAMSIKEYGFRQPIVVDKDRVIVAGHTRYKAAKRLGLSNVPISIADKLSNKQIKAYRLADNRVAQEAKWDNNLLSEELFELRELDFDLSLTGFENLELKNILNENDLTVDDLKINDKTEFLVVVECTSENEQQKFYDEVMQRGFKCKLIM